MTTDPQGRNFSLIGKAASISMTRGTEVLTPRDMKRLYVADGFVWHSLFTEKKVTCTFHKFVFSLLEGKISLL